MSNVIGAEVDVLFVGKNSSVIGKVDTGATMSCLHATDIKVSGNNVSFICDDLSSNTIIMPIADSISVSSADGGSSERPVVRFDISINGHTLNDIEFNLNDRSHMDAPCLIGQNAIEAGGFVVDITENVLANQSPVDVQSDSVVDVPAGEPKVEQEQNNLPETVEKDAEIAEAIEVLVRHGILGAEFENFFVKGRIIEQTTEIQQ